MKHSNTKHLTVHSDEASTLKQALKADFSEEGRISIGAYARLLAERRLQELEGVNQ